MATSPMRYGITEKCQHLAKAFPHNPSWGSLWRAPAPLCSPPVVEGYIAELSVQEELSEKSRRCLQCVALRATKTVLFGPIRPLYTARSKVGALLVPLFRESLSPTSGEAGISRCASLKTSVIVVPITREQTGRSDDIPALHHW